MRSCSCSALASSSHVSARKPGHRSLATLHHVPAAVLRPATCCKTRHCLISRIVAHATPQEAAPLEAPTLEPIADEAQLESESKWLAKGIQTWLDEEWQLQENHRDVGEATAQAYRSARAGGENDVGSILLDIGSELQAFDFTDTFTGPFDVANKAVEMLMLVANDGDVCCTSPEDKQRVQELGTFGADT